MFISLKFLTSPMHRFSGSPTTTTPTSSYSTTTTFINAPCSQAYPALRACGVTVVFTSNCDPEALYRKGLNREVRMFRSTSPRSSTHST
jgi:hypothetical protein